MSEDLARHCGEIDACNQRGGRMLSVVDLLGAGTLPRELAAYLLAAVRSGASFMVGALPGGAGKTTVMGALLNFVPPGVELRAAEDLETLRGGLARPDSKRCWICHEIGRGSYYAYLWGEALRAYFELARRGHQLATNLHADTLEQARDQVCGDNGVPPEDFRRMNLALFLRVSAWGRRRREIVEVWESDGTSDHRKIYEGGRLRTDGLRQASPEDLRQAGRRIDDLLASGARTIGEVRAFLVGR